MSNTPQADLDALWNWVVTEVKKATNTPNFWRALEATKPLTVENRELLVLGINPAQAQAAGLLNQDLNRNLIEQLLERATKTRLRIRVIHGDTLEDWEAEKQMQVQAARLQQEHKEQVRKRVDSGGDWEAISEQLVRRYNEYPNRLLTSAQGRFLSEAVVTLAEAYARLMSEPLNEELDRSYSRVLDRLGDRLRVPPTVLAYLVNERLKK